MKIILRTLFVWGTISAANSYAACDACLSGAIGAGSGVIGGATAATTAALATAVGSSAVVSGAISASGASITAAINAGNAAWVGADTAVSTQFQTLLSQELGKLEFEVSKQADKETTLNDYFLDELYELMRRTRTAMKAIEKDDTFGPRSQPQSNTIAIDRSESLIELHFQNENLKSDIMSAYVDYANEAPNTSSGNSARFYEELYDLGVDAFDPTQLIYADSVSDDDFDRLQTLVLYLTNLKPVKEITSEEIDDDPSLLESAIEQKKYNAKIFAIQDAIVHLLTSKKRAMPTEWAEDTFLESVLAATTDAELISLDELLRIEAYGRYANPDWYAHIRQLKPVGLMREQTYVSTSRNYLLSELIKTQEHIAMVESIEALNEIQNSIY